MTVKFNAHKTPTTSNLSFVISDIELFHINTLAT